MIVEKGAYMLGGPGERSTPSEMPSTALGAACGSGVCSAPACRSPLRAVTAPTADGTPTVGSGSVPRS